MLQEGIIKPNNNCYSFPVLLVRKKDGTWCFCVDYQALNLVTIHDWFSIPSSPKKQRKKVQEIFHKFIHLILFIFDDFESHLGLKARGRHMYMSNAYYVVIKDFVKSISKYVYKYCFDMAIKSWSNIKKIEKKI